MTAAIATVWKGPACTVFAPSAAKYLATVERLRLRQAAGDDRARQAAMVLSTYPRFMGVKFACFYDLTGTRTVKKYDVPMVLAANGMD